MMCSCLQIAKRLSRVFSNQNVTGVLRLQIEKNSPIAFQNLHQRSKMSLWPFSAKPRDFSQPNASWSSEMRKVYDQYDALCEEATEGGEMKKGPWRKLPSYNRSLKYAKGGVYLSKLVQSKARLFTRSIKEPGAAFEYVVFMNKEEKRCVCVFQSGHLLEGPPGHVHGGATATMIDSVTGTLAGFLCGPVMTANLSINYRSPIPLGSVVLIHSALDRVEGRKIFLTCRVTSVDDSKLHTEATEGMTWTKLQFCDSKYREFPVGSFCCTDWRANALFLSVNMGHFFGA